MFKFSTTPGPDELLIHGMTPDRAHFMVGSILPRASLIHYEVNDRCVFQGYSQARTEEALKAEMLALYQEYSGDMASQ